MRKIYISAANFNMSQAETMNCISAANFNLTQAETIAKIREMGLTCVRVSDVRFRLGYPLGDPRRIYKNKDTETCADSLAALYDKALGWHYWGPLSLRAAKRLQAAADSDA